MNRSLQSLTDPIQKYWNWYSWGLCLTYWRYGSTPHSSHSLLCHDDGHSSCTVLWIEEESNSSRAGCKRDFPAHSEEEGELRVQGAWTALAMLCIQLAFLILEEGITKSHNHRITEWLKLERTSGGNLVCPLCSGRAVQSPEPRPDGFWIPPQPLQATCACAPPPSQ